MCADWNNNNNVGLWREDWARVNNKLFKEKGLKIRVDHRSYERQDVNRVPTIHEGYGARLRAKNGKECDRIEINRYITNINEKMNFRRFMCRGQKNVLAESILLAMAHNINKLHNKIQKDRTGKHLFELKKIA